MTISRCSLCLLVLTLFSPLLPRVYADDLTASLTVDGGVGALVYADVAGVETYTYVNVFTDLADTRTTTFTATYTNDLGVGLLSVTDVCAQVTVVFTQPIACQALAFDFTDLSLLHTAVLLDVGANISVLNNGADFTFAGADVSGGSGSVQFTNPPPPPPSATPEPESLALLATGIFGVAGVVRRKRKA